VGFKDNAYVLAFDLSYFNKYGAMGLRRKLMQYPKEIRDAWKRYVTGGCGGSSTPDARGQWLVLDNAKTVVTKIGSKREHPWGVPISAAALSDILYYNYFVNTKRNLLDSLNNILVYQEFPEGEKKNASSLTQTQQREQHNVIKNALTNRAPGQWALKFFSVAPGTKINKLDTDVGIFDSKNEADLLERTAGDVGFAAALLNGVSKGNYASLKLNMELVSAKVMSYVKQFERELVKVINYNVIQDPTCFMDMDYLPMSHVNKADMIGQMKDLYLQGKGSWQAWVASTGLNFDSFVSMLEDERDNDYENAFPLHKTSYTISDKDAATDADNTGGRPANGQADNENTVKSQQTGGGEQERPGV
jgi:hypothetical protein